MRSMGGIIEIDGLERFQDADGNLPEKVLTAIVRAVNRTADRTRTRAAGAVRDQVAFPASYLSPSEGRLSVAQRARKDELVATIRGRDRATSLATFAKQKVTTSGTERPKGNKIDVRMKAGGGFHSIPRSFLIRLKNNNVGLAVRTDGETPRNAYRPKEIGKNLWLLYGASVDQALQAASDGDGVYEELSPDALDFLVNEFERQLDVLGVTDA